jgi:hypothetical protein
MKCILPVIVILLAAPASSQVNQHAAQSFIAALNNLVTHTTSQHWEYEAPFTIDSAFHLNGDSLTATFRYKTDTSFFRIRYAASIRNIVRIEHDIYLSMVYKRNEVQMYQQTGEGPWEYSGSRNLYHIGMVATEDQQKLKADIERSWLWLRNTIK